MTPLCCPECRNQFEMPDEDLISPDPGEVVMIRCDACGITRKAAAFVAAMGKALREEARAAADREADEHVRMQRAAAAVAMAREDRELAAKIAADRQAVRDRNDDTRREQTAKLNYEFYGKSYPAMRTLERTGTVFIVLGAIAFIFSILGCVAASSARRTPDDLVGIWLFSSGMGGGLWMIGLGYVLQTLSYIWGCVARTARKANPVDNPEVWE